MAKLLTIFAKLSIIDHFGGYDLASDKVLVCEIRYLKFVPIDKESQLGNW